MSYEGSPPAYEDIQPLLHDGNSLNLRQIGEMAESSSTRDAPRAMQEQISPRTAEDRIDSGRFCQYERFYLAIVIMIIAGFLMIGFNIAAICKERESIRFAERNSKIIHEYFNTHFMRHEDRYYNSDFKQNVSPISSSFGHGIWGGIWLVFTGAFGIYGGVSKAKCPMRTFLILSLISLAVMAGSIYCSVFAANFHYDTVNSLNTLNVGTLNIVVGILAGIGALASFIASIRACLIMCCNIKPEQSIRCDPIIIEEIPSNAENGAPQRQYVIYPGNQMFPCNRPPATLDHLPTAYTGPTDNQQQDEHFNLQPTKENAEYEQ